LPRAPSVSTTIITEETYRKKFGEEGFEEVKRMKEWIEEHPRKQEIIAFLMYASK